MEALVLGGTRYFGIHLVQALLENGHDVTIATRGHAEDNFGKRVKRMKVDRTSAKSMKEVFKNKEYDVVCDNLAYCSNDVQHALLSINCRRYIMVSSASVYNLHDNTLEKDFDPLQAPFEWCDRTAYSYDKNKQFAESALFQTDKAKSAAAVRFPFVIGADDYTKRLHFYVEHTIKQIPMFVDNGNAQMSFVRSDEAGRFLAFLAEQEYRGAVNGSSDGTISIAEIVRYVEAETGIRAAFSDDGDPAPYNGTADYSINNERAAGLGFRFSPIKDWIFDLLDQCIAQM